MNKLLGLLAALALTAGAASCGTSDTDTATDAASDAETTDGATDDAVTDEALTDEAATDEMVEAGDVDVETMLAIMGEIDADAAAFEAGNVVVIRVNDLTVVDPTEALVSESTIEITDQTLPLPFEVVVDRADLDPTYKYSLRIVINDASGEMIYTTNSANSFGGGAETVDMGTVSLVSAG